MNNIIDGETNASDIHAPWLSILIPVFNVEAYLAECVASVMSQADEKVEVILLDDCSTDGSWELIQSLAQRWPGRLVILRHAQNGGLSAARNTMINVAQGKYLWFLDSDDKLLPHAVQELKTVVIDYAPDVVLCDFQVWREKPKLKHRLRGEHCKRTFAGTAFQLLQDRAVLLSGLLRTGQLHAWSKISRRALWQNGLRFPPGRYFEDMLTMSLMVSEARSFYYVPRPWVAYRQRTSSILASMNIKKARDQSAALLPLYARLQNQEWVKDRSLRFALAHQCARNFIGAMRYLSRQSEGALPAVERNNLASEFRADFASASPLTESELQRAYLQRGWWIRWLKFRQWLWYAKCET